MTTTYANRPTPPTFHLVASPWDFPIGERPGSGRDISETLDQLRGEIGLTGLALWGATGTSREFRVRDLRPRLHANEGGIHFEPVRYRGRCRPMAATATKALWPTIAQASSRFGLSLRMLMATATMGGLAKYYPEFASQSAFDDSSASSVCLLNSAVQDCVTDLVENVPPQFGVHQIVLSDFCVGWRDSQDGAIRWPCPLGAVERAVLGVCFCPACVSVARDANVEAEQARLSVKNVVHRSMTQGASIGGSIVGFLGEQTALAAYLDVQSRELAALLARIVESSRAEILIERKNHALVAVAQNAVCGGTIEQARELTFEGAPKTAGRHEITLPSQLLIGPGAEPFVSAMAQLSERGYDGVQIDHLGALPDSAFQTLKQAIRFARRSAVL